MGCGTSKVAVVTYNLQRDERTPFRTGLGFLGELGAEFKQDIFQVLGVELIHLALGIPACHQVLVVRLG